jgi:hypothetical protein
VTTAREPARLGTVVVCGGGCYGSYYVRQLARAQRAGAVDVRDIVVVDQDAECRVAHTLRSTSDFNALPVRMVTEKWAPFFATWFERVLAQPESFADAAVVPSPLMPHLLADWTESRLRVCVPDAVVQRTSLPVTPDTPWQREGAGPTHYTSFATWMCPINCIEPARCPETRGPRDWTMPAAVAGVAQAADGQGTPFDHVAVFHTRHVVYGVGMFTLEPLAKLERALRVAGMNRGARFLVASVSHCHGALAAIEVREPQSADTAA